jgi:hypothetical protein
MERFGQMLQIDASPFDWLSNGSMISLHGAIDDGTGNVTALRFEPAECLDGSFRVLEETVLAYGVPRSIDSDAHSIFFSPKPDRLTLVEELRGARDGLTQFGKALDILGISPIKALSPQAKGRIERLWGTLQHRLVVDLRVTDEITAFMPAPSRQDLALVLCRRAFAEEDWRFHPILEEPEGGRCRRAGQKGPLPPRDRGRGPDPVGRSDGPTAWRSLLQACRER